MIAHALVVTLAMLGVDYRTLECERERFLHRACDIVKPSPLYAPEDFDTCLRHEFRCHLRMSD